MQILFFNFVIAIIANTFCDNGKRFQNKHQSCQTLLTVYDDVFLQCKTAAFGSHKYDCPKKMLVAALHDAVNIVQQAVTVGFRPVIITLIYGNAEQDFICSYKVSEHP